jgi:alpha-galactosidase
MTEEQTLRIRSAVEDKSKKVTDVFSTIASSEPMIPLIEALACDIEHKIIVNIPNKGSCVQGIPEDFEVEIPAIVSGRGIQGIQAHPLPPAVLAYLLRDRIAPVEMELQALIHQDKNLLLSLIMMDPWCTSEAQAARLLDEILNLPCNKEMKEYYR